MFWRLAPMAFAVLMLFITYITKQMVHFFLMYILTWHILGDRRIPLASSFELIVGFDECGTH